jgi:hypothetical protein
MISKKELGKEDQGRGRNVYYSISEVTKKRHQLKILNIDYKQEIFKKIYEKIFLYELFEGLYKRTSLPDVYLGIYEDVIVPYDIMKRIITDSESKFNDFLSKLNIVREQILWGTMVFGPYEFTTLIDDLQSPGKYSHGIRKEYWNKINGRSRIHAEKLRFFYPKENDRDFMIYALENWEIRKRTKYNLSGKLIKTRYLVFMPGITVQDIMEDNHFNKEEIEDAFKKLKEVGLMKERIYGSESRYVIADNHLREFIDDLRELFRDEFGFLLFRWRNFESPTIEERNRMESIFGKEQFREIFRNCQIRLSRHRDKVMKCANIEEYNDVLKQNTDSGALRTQLDICFDKFIKNTKKVPKSKNKSQHVIKSYKKYLIEKIDFALNGISYNNEVLEKYKFLDGVFKLILPKPFEPINDTNGYAIQYNPN